MNQFEDQLREALRREEPPADFTDRVMRRIQEESRPKVVRMPLRRWFPVAAAACMLLSAGVWRYEQYRGEKARDQLLLALEITGEKIALTQQKVDSISQRTIP